jgi:drug/metabolite transporter (DMT)-like permease
LTGLAVSGFLRIPLPRDWKTWRVVGFLGLINVALPFFLISWGEQKIDSAVASILNATVPLFTIVIAHFFTHDDKITASKVIGLLIGFLGVVLLLSKDIKAETPNNVVGQGAVILASVCYAIGVTYARRTTQHIPAEIRGTLTLVSATMVMWAIAPVAEAPLVIPRLPLTWVALLWLGVLGSGLAFIMNYYLLHEIGPTRTTLVTYVFPLGGVLLGVIFLREPLSWQLAVGAALIISSIAVVNRKTK